MLTARNAITWVGLVLLIGVVVGCGSGATTSNVTVVQMEASGTGCTPDKINTAQGFLIKITLKNTGTREAVFDFPEAPFKLTAPAGQTTLGDFTAPTKTGSYQFTCGASGQSGGMTRGEIVVRSSQ